ncbi:MAG: oligosaccharide flippase family protein [[Actinobacillus] rossii]|nr:oligosaccharide flippase family protein [[Actinobacillus] rossii]
MNNSQSLAGKLLKSSLLYSVGSIGTKILSFVLVPLYTFFLTKEDVGIYDLIITIISLCIPIVTLQISDALYRWLIDDQYIDRKEIIGTAIWIFLIAYSIVMLIMCMLSIFWRFVYIEYFLILLFLNSILLLFQSILRGTGELKFFALTGMGTSFLVFILNVIFFSFTKLGIEGVFLSIILSYVVVSGILVRKLSIFCCIKLFNTKCALEMIKYSLPLVPNIMSIWLISSASRIIILYKLGVDSNAIYAISIRFASILFIVNSVLIYPIQDYILKHNNFDENFKIILKKYVKFEFSIAGLLIVCCPIYMLFIVDESFYESWKYIPFLLIGVSIDSISALLGVYYQKIKKTLNITISSLMGGFFCICISYFLVEYYALYAMSFSYFISLFLVLFIRNLNLRKYSNVDVFDFYSVIYMILLLFLSFLVIRLDEIYYQLYLSFFVILGIIIMNKDLLKRGVIYVLQYKKNN